MSGVHSARWFGLGLVLVAGGCHPRLFPLLDAPATEASSLLQEIRLAHTGGKPLLWLTCTREDDYRPGLGEIVAPELGPFYQARNGFDFPAGTAWQVVHRGDNRFLWAWDGASLLTQRDGSSYSPWPGADRGEELRGFMMVLHPEAAASQDGTEAVLLPRAGSRQRLGLRRDGAMVTLEVHPKTHLVEAVEYTVKQYGRALRHRAELEDYRDVGSTVVVPHRIREFVRVGPVWLPLRTTRLQDVQAVVDSAYPKAGLPGFLDQPVQHPELPAPAPEEPSPVVPVKLGGPG